LEEMLKNKLVTGFQKIILKINLLLDSLLDLLLPLKEEWDMLVPLFLRVKEMLLLKLELWKKLELEWLNLLQKLEVPC
jgi:hypothetical protein